MTEHLQLSYVAQVKNTEDWLESLVTDIEGRIDAAKETEPTAESAVDSVAFAAQSLAAIQGQRAALLDIRDNKLDTQDRRDDVTRVVQECRRAEEVIKQWIAWLEYQEHRLARLRDEDDSLPPE